MAWLRRNYKTVVGALIILILIEAVIAWYLIDRFRENYLSGDEALAIAMADAGAGAGDARKTDVRLKTAQGKAWYEIEIETSGGAYRYLVDAETGALLPGRPG